MTFHVNKARRLMAAITAAAALVLSTAGYANNGSAGGRSNFDPPGGKEGATTSPIKHVIILIGENRGLDHTFGTYKPKGRGEFISNILTKGIVNEDRLARSEFRGRHAVLGRGPADLLRRCA